MVTHESFSMDHEDEYVMYSDEVLRGGRYNDGCMEGKDGVGEEEGHDGMRLIRGCWI